MYSESSTIKAPEKQESHENYEALISVESPEQIRQKMMDAATQEIAHFTEECSADLGQAEARAEKDGLVIDAEDKNALQEIGAEADVAKDELVVEIDQKNMEGNKIIKEKFGGFVKYQKELYRGNGMDIAKEASHQRKYVLRDAEFMQNYINEYLAKTEELREEIESKKSTIINRVLEFRQIRQLEKQLASQENILDNYKKGLAQKKELVDAYDYLIGEEEKLVSLEKDAYAENFLFDNKKKAEIFEEEKRRNVKTLIEKHKVFFVHGIISAEWKPSQNNKAINTANLDYEDQLNIVMGLDPTISVSTLSPDSKNGIFGNAGWGVLLSGGRVLGGEQSDAQTQGLGLKNRHISEGSRSIEAIDKAIERPDGGGKIASSSYNELVMEDPEVAGVYFKYGDYFPQLKEGDDISLKGNFDGARLTDKWWEMLENSMKTGAPIFVIDSKNIVRMVYDINISEKKFKVTPEYDPSNLIDMPSIYKQHTGKEEKRKSVMRVFDKVIGVISEDEKKTYIPDGTEDKNSNYTNVH